MEKFILWFFDHFSTMIFVIVVYGFYFVFSKGKNQLKKRPTKIVLTKKNIIKESDIFFNLLLILMLIVALLSGTATICLGLMFNQIALILFGSIFVFVPLYFFFERLSNCFRVLNGDYVVVIDTLKDKEMFNDHLNRTVSDRFYFFFDNYFRKYNKKINVHNSLYYKSKIGDKFYLLFVKNNVYVFSCDDYELEDTTKIIDIERLENYVKIVEIKRDNYLDFSNDNIAIKINKKTIINDFFDKKEKSTVVISILITIFLMIFLVIILLFFRDIKIFIIVLIMFGFFMFFMIVKISYLVIVIRNIHKGNYYVKIDEVLSLNEDVQFKDSNEFMSLKFKDSKKIVFGEKRNYRNVLVGDKFYLVFVKGESDPIKVYNVKNSMIEDNTKIKQS